MGKVSLGKAGMRASARAPPNGAKQTSRRATLAAPPPRVPDPSPTGRLRPTPAAHDVLRPRCARGFAAASGANSSSGRALRSCEPLRGEF